MDLPVVVEIVDSKENIDAFPPLPDEMMTGALVTTERVQVLQYGSEAIKASQVANHCVSAGTTIPHIST